MRQTLNSFIMILVLIFATAAHAATWYVNAAGGGDATTIQGGIDLAANGDVVLVAPGTYSGAGNVNLTYGGKGITVASESGAHFAIIDCQGIAQGVLFNSGEGSDAVLEGFTIRNGNGSEGGAVYCDGTSPTIRFNVFSNNNATTAGGALHLKNASPTIHNNTIDGCGSPNGGGLCVEGTGSASIYQNIVCNSTSGGAYWCLGNDDAFVVCNNTYANSGGLGDVICAGNSGNNFSEDPRFCGIPGSGNFYVQQTSPCSAAFSPCLQSVGALGVNCSVTATETATWGAVKSLYR